MKKLLLTLILLCSMHVYAQYFGIPAFQEGFDGTEFPLSWTQANTTQGDPCRWIPGKNASAPFSKVDPASTHSLEITINQGNKPYLTLTSPEIDLGGKSALVAGFYGFELSYGMRGQITFLFRITKDGGSTWTNLFDSERDSYNSGMKVSGWDFYKYDLPAGFDGAKVKLQFLVDATSFTGYGGLPAYIDGVFVSERFPVDLAIGKIYNFSSDPNTPSSRVLTDQEAVSVDFTNLGSQPVTGLELYYQVDDRETVVETYVPEQLVRTSQQVKYTFTAKADLSRPLASFTLKAGVRKEGDGEPGNNETFGYAENMACGIPYYPRFHWDDEGVPTVSEDNWKTDENEPWAGYWELDRSGTFWLVDNEYSDENCDAYLISRPVVLEKGKTYEICFDAWVDAETAGYPLNSMKVCVSMQNDITSALTPLWENQAIGTTNAKNSFARYTATVSGPHYFMFNCTSQPTPDYLKVLPLSVTEVRRHDIGIMSLLSPDEDTYRFTNSETVSVLVRNFGSETVRSSEATLTMQLNGGEIVSQPLGSDLPAGENKEFTFTRKADLSDINLKKTLKISASYASDENLQNNTLETTVDCMVSGIPYLPDFGKDRFPTKEASRWTAVDVNKDGYTFSSVSDGTLGTYVFSYGGNTTRPTIVLQKSDEQLYSRPIWLEAGTTYRLSYLSRIGKASGNIPVKVLLYSIDGDQKVRDKEIHSVEVTTAGFAENLVNLQIDRSGIYEVCFSVSMDTPIDYKVFLGGFKLTKVYEYDLELTEIVPAAATVSCAGKFPVGVIVTNTGKKEMNSFVIRAQSDSSGSRQTTIDRTIAPGEATLCYFDEDFTFDGTDEESLTASVESVSDLNTDNDTKSVTIRYVSPSNAPYNTGFYTCPDGWAALNNNRDDSRFEFVAGNTGGFRFNNPDKRQPGDLLKTRCMALEKDKLYRVAFYSKVLQAGDSASFDVYVDDGHTDEKIAIASFRNYTNSTGTQYFGFFRVPADGNYSICFDVKESTNSVMFYNQFEVKEAYNRPDIRLVEVTSPLQDAVFTSGETLSIKFVNDGEELLQTIPFTCETGGKTYYAIHSGALSAGDEAEVSFTQVDLGKVGEYRIKFSAQVSCDATPENNMLECVLHSLPVTNVSLTGLVSPLSGVLSAEESVCVKVKNSGKGALAQIPLNAVVTAPDGGTARLSGTVENALPENETIEYTFPNKVDMYAEGTYTVEVSTSLEGDVDVTDNVYKASVVSTHKEFDAGVTRLVAPADGLLGEETVTVTVTNFTDVDLYGVPVSAVIQSVPDVQDQAEPVKLDGVVENLPANASADYTFTQTVSMKTAGDYRVKSYTSVRNDVNAANDTLTVVIRCWKKDAGVVEILAPETGYDLQTQEITVRVKNFGEAPLSQIPVRYKAGSIPQLGTVVQNLDPGETVDYTFATPYEFVAYKKYTVTAYTELDGDADPANDGCKKEIENLKPDGIASAEVSCIGVYPNPARDLIHIDAGEAQIRRVSVFSAEGIPVIQKDPAGVTAYKLPLSLPSGTYLLKVELDKGTVYEKLIVR